MLALVVLAALGVTAALALAAPPPGKGKAAASTSTSTDGTTTASTHGKKPAKTGPSCRPQVALMLKGTLAADGAAAPSDLSVTVTGGNHAGRAYKAGTQPVAVAITAKTKITRRGKHDATLLKSGDRVIVQARVCKADLANGATPAPTAKKVTAKPAKSSSSDETTTSTDTTTNP